MTRSGALQVVLLFSWFGVMTLVGCEASSESQTADTITDAAEDVTLGPPCTTWQDCAGLAVAGGCEVSTCDLATGSCALFAAPSGTPCAASEATCGEPGVCDSGSCVAPLGTVGDCDDENLCTVDLCSAGEGCVNLPVPNGNTCDDGDVCTDGDACVGGLCLGTEDPDCVAATCGDGVCTGAETEASCPEDCAERATAECGDGVCENSESQASCPADCSSGDPTCGDGLCEGAEAFFCPQDCQ